MLALFHLVGKVLYNKRMCGSIVRRLMVDHFNANIGKGDPPPASATKRERLAEQALDTTLKNPKPLPSWIKFEERRTSRVDIDVSSSLFDKLFVHHSIISMDRHCMRTRRLMHHSLDCISIKTILNSVKRLTSAMELWTG